MEEVSPPIIKLPGIQVEIIWMYFRFGTEVMQT